MKLGSDIADNRPERLAKERAPVWHGSDPARSNRVKTLLMEALQLQAHQRTSFIFAETDSLVRDEVLSLIAAHERAGTFMGDPSSRIQARSDVAPAKGEEPGAMIGHYRLLNLIGEGGFGRVYLADQREPVMRQVALKIIKVGMDTRQVITRFEAERQVLAMMEHPGIARVIDAGATDSGRPYFVMELVQGVPITAYCDEHRLTVDQRLELFRQLCEAVQYAHLKGIIHRDLKPNNLLVVQNNGRPMLKVIDFGIAKATSGRLGEHEVTEIRQLLGTPDYMSPEQADLQAADIDTRADVYSLGVVLYELLCGTTPLDQARLHSGSFAEMQRMIREEEPPRPSARVAAELDRNDVGMNRSISPARLATQLRGDLDWITLKALEKDRDRRYATPAELAEDIRRHLNHQPVVAAPPAVGYLLRKFMRRHRAAVVAGVLVILTLVAGTIGTTIGLVRATQAGALAELEADKARQIAMFSQQMLAGINPSIARGKDTQLLRIILDEAAARVEKDLVDQPEVEAAIRTTIGSAYLALAQYELAGPQLDRALAIRRSILGNNDPETLASASHMGRLMWVQGKFTEAESFWQEALEGRRRVLGPDHPDSLKSLNELGNLRWDQGRLDEAEAFLREALEARRRTLGNVHPDTLKSINNMGAILRDQGKVLDAEMYFRESLDGHRTVLGNDHPSTLAAIMNMGRLVGSQANLAEAEAYLTEGVSGYRHVMGHDHPETLAAINSLAVLLNRQGKFVEAELMYREVLETRRRVLGDDHPNTLLSLNNVGSILADQDKFEDARIYFGEALERQTRTLGPDHPDTLRSLHNMGSMLQQLGHFREAETMYLQALEGRLRKFGAQSPLTAATAKQLASLLLTGNDEVRDPHRALELAMEANAATGYVNPEYLDILATAHFQTGNVEMAFETEAKAIELLPGDSPARQAYEQQLKAYEAVLMRGRIDADSNTLPESRG